MEDKKLAELKSKLIGDIENLVRVSKLSGKYPDEQFYKDAISDYSGTIVVRTESITLRAATLEMKKSISTLSKLTESIT